MDWTGSGVASALMVGLIMWLARRSGQRMAGLVAGMPTVTAPVLVWVACDRGAAFAAEAAVASVAACAMLAAFALGYAQAARRAGVAWALCCSLAASCALAPPSWAVSQHLPAALALAIVANTLALACLNSRHRLRPEPPTEPGTPMATSRGALGLSAAGAASLSACAALVGPLLGTFMTGLLSSMPVITGSVAVATHLERGASAVSVFLRGYVLGLFGKAVFGTVFALVVVRVGPGWALGLAVACACLTSAAASRWSSRPVRARPPSTDRPQTGHGTVVACAQALSRKGHR